MINRQKLHYLFYLPLFALYAFVLFYFINTSVMAIQCPFTLENGEGFVLHTSIQYQKGILPYKDITQPHNLVNNYPPIFNLLCNFLDPLFDFSFASGRFVSFLSLLGISVFLFLSVRLITGSILWSIISGISFLVVPFIFNIVRYRVDALAIFFSITGLYFFLLAIKKDSHWWLCITFLLLGIYTKHISVSAPAAILLLLFLMNHKRKWFFSIRFLSGLLIPGLILQLITNGYFLKHVI